jgi:hypothetical protein
LVDVCVLAPPLSLFFLRTPPTATRGRLDLLAPPTSPPPPPLPALPSASCRRERNRQVAAKPLLSPPPAASIDPPGCRPREVACDLFAPPPSPTPPHSLPLPWLPTTAPLPPTSSIAHGEEKEVADKPILSPPSAAWARKDRWSYSDMGR